MADGVATLTINDPDKRNAINLAMNDEIVDTMEALENSGDVNAIVVTGAPPAFCAGADLGDLLDARDRGNIHEIYRGFLRIAHSPIPTVAAVNGAAVGAGMNMALACDVILAAESARFDSRFLDIGIHPGGGHTWRLRNKTDDQTMRAMVLFGEILSGDRAAEIGLAWRCVAGRQSCSRRRSRWLAAPQASPPSSPDATKASHARPGNGRHVPRLGRTRTRSPAGIDAVAGVHRAGHQAPQLDQLEVT